MSEIVFRDTVESDYRDLAAILDKQWRFGIYSKEHALDLAELFLVDILDGSNRAVTVEVDGRPQGILVLSDMGGDTMDKSAEIEPRVEAVRNLPNFERCMVEMEGFHRIYNDFAKLYKHEDWAELALIIVSDSCKGIGLGRKVIEEARRITSEYGKTGLFFYTDTECNYGFYDHIGAVRVGEDKTPCMGVDLDVFVYYLEFRSQTST